MPPPPRPLATSSVLRRESLPYQNDCLRCPSRHVIIDHRRHRHPAVDLSASHRTSFRDAPLDHREVQLNKLVGDGIVGILHKWVNYGKGWRPRWFVLHDGVLSYYKIHGPDCIDLSQESEKGPKVIGEESARLLACWNKIGSHRPRKPVGEVHLEVSSIRESRTDDKRFSIFSGTKRLYLRAETGDDRVAWVETLQAVKDMLLRISNSELMAPVDKLRERLQEEEVTEATIQDCEQIVRTEFTALQKQLALLKQKQALLVDTLCHLETGKADLENIDGDASQRQSKKKGSAYGSRHEKYSGMVE